MVRKIQLISIVVALISMVVYIVLFNTPGDGYATMKSICIGLFVIGSMLNAGIEIGRFFKNRL